MLLVRTAGVCARCSGGHSSGGDDARRAASVPLRLGPPNGRLPPPAMTCHRPATDLPPSAITCHHLPRPVSFGAIRGRFGGQVARRAADDARADHSTVARWHLGTRAPDGGVKVLVWCLSNRCSRKTLGGNSEDGNELLRADDERWCDLRMGDDPVGRVVSNRSPWDRRQAMDGGFKGLWGLSPSATSRRLRNARGESEAPTEYGHAKVKMQNAKV